MRVAVDLIQNLDEGGLAGLVNGDHLATNVLLRAAHRARFAVSDGSAQKAPRDVNIFVAAEAHASAVSQIIPRGLSFRDGGNVREHHGFKFARVTHGSQGNLGTAGVAISAIHFEFSFRWNSFLHDGFSRGSCDV